MTEEHNEDTVADESVDDLSLQVFTAEDGTEFHPYADQDGKKCWRIGNQIISEDALLEFADDFSEEE